MPTHKFWFRCHLKKNEERFRSPNDGLARNLSSFANTVSRDSLIDTRSKTETAFFETHETLVANHEMVENVNIKQLSCLDNLARNRGILR